MLPKQGRQSLFAGPLIHALMLPTGRNEKPHALSPSSSPSETYDTSATTAEEWLEIAGDVTIERDGQPQPLLPPDLQERLASALASEVPMTYSDWNTLHRDLFHLYHLPQMRCRLRVPYEDEDDLAITAAPKEVQASKRLWDAFIRRSIDGLSHAIQSTTLDDIMDEMRQSKTGTNDARDFFFNYCTIREWYIILTRFELDIATGTPMAELPVLGRLIAAKCIQPLALKEIELGFASVEMDNPLFRDIAISIFAYRKGNEGICAGTQPDSQEERERLNTAAQEWSSAQMQALRAELNPTPPSPTSQD